MSYTDVHGHSLFEKVMDQWVVVGCLPLYNGYHANWDCALYREGSLGTGPLGLV